MKKSLESWTWVGNNFQKVKSAVGFRANIPNFNESLGPSVGPPFPLKENTNDISIVYRVGGSFSSVALHQSRSVEEGGGRGAKSTASIINHETFSAWIRGLKGRVDSSHSSETETVISLARGDHPFVILSSGVRTNRP